MQEVRYILHGKVYTMQVDVPVEKEWVTPSSDKGSLMEIGPIENTTYTKVVSYNECRVTDDDEALNPESYPDWANEYDDALSCEGCAFEEGCAIK